METRIKRFAKFFRAIFFLILVLTPLTVGALWLTGGEVFVTNAEGNAVIELLADDILHDTDIVPSLPLPWKTRWTGLAVTMLPASIGMLSMWWLVRLFGCFAQGEIFTQDTVRYLRLLGWTMIAGVIASPVYQTLLSILLSMQNVQVERVGKFSLETAEFEDLLAAGVIILVSWIMDEGRKLRESDELTV